MQMSGMCCIYEAFVLVMILFRQKSALPDFLDEQRNSFWSFIEFGIREELDFFSPIVIYLFVVGGFKKEVVVNFKNPTEPQPPWQYP